MSDLGPLQAQLSDVQRHVVYDGDGDIPHDVYSLLEDLANAVDALTATATTESAAVTVGMSRADALKIARDHVEAMSTGARGYQDGVKLSDKVSAVDRFARFLMGETE
ncbi:hypothetical protein OTB20_08435 [Streptomyces sp. H27-H1]|uniref:hypothetical protein n=1 Tax=Streptomyces sp. H27-H1 TaxID=2996461 RepID=UPI002270F0AE|nr:hypothetical protein [Streptomyces sp. H27-H1]MCY0926232.1 hypothetical protein [Streptomyces sp. H27-H1]